MIEDFIQYVKNNIEARPDLKKEFEGIRDLCLSEIESGESESHEIELAKEDMRQLMESDE
jgi:hypothetical protein